MKNYWKRSGTRTQEFWKSFRKVAGKRVHWIFWKFNYLKIMNGQIIRIVRQFSRTAYFIMIKCNICACIHMIDKRRWLYTENAGQEMLSKFSDNLRMLHGKRKRQITEYVYNRRKNTSGLPVDFFWSFFYYFITFSLHLYIDMVYYTCSNLIIEYGYRPPTSAGL